MYPLFVIPLVLYGVHMSKQCNELKVFYIPFSVLLYQEGNLQRKKRGMIVLSDIH